MSITGLLRYPANKVKIYKELKLQSLETFGAPINNSCQDASNVILATGWCRSKINKRVLYFNTNEGHIWIPCGKVIRRHFNEKLISVTDARNQDAGYHYSVPNTTLATNWRRSKINRNITEGHRWMSFDKVILTVFNGHFLL